MGGNLDPAVAKARNLVRAGLQSLPSGSTVGVAVSGGADSLALAAAVGFVATTAGWRVRAVVVDHQLQVGSAEVAAAAASTVHRLGIDTDVIRVDVGSRGGPEAAARTARYAALNRVEADVMLLGHTLDDQAETVLLGLGRGSGPRSMRAMASAEGHIRRPFLHMRRAETQQVCRASGIEWWTDPHNADPAYTRVRLRCEVLPLLEDVLGGGVAGALARTADQLRADSDYLDSLANDYSWPLTVAELRSIPEAVRRRVLRLAALAAGARASEMSAHHVERLDALVMDSRGRQVIELPGAVVATRSGDCLAFGPNTAVG